MYNHNSPSDFRTFRTEQHVSLEKHQQMIETSLRWDQASTSIDEQPNLFTVYLRKIFFFMRELMVNRLLPKRKRNHQPYSNMPIRAD